MPNSLLGNDIDLKLGIYTSTFREPIRLQVRNVSDLAIDEGNTRVSIERLRL